MAADVYSLGVMLYERLTGQTPFTAETPLELLRQVREVEPPRPSSIIPGLDRDLETICLKCLEKEPAKRYGSAEALAQDLERWLQGVPIHARPSSAWERLRKWARRRPTAAALAMVSVLAALTVMTVILLYNDTLASANAQLRQALQDTFVAKEDAETQRDDARKAQRLAREQEFQANRQLYLTHINLLQPAWEQGQVEHVRELLGYHERPGEKDVRGFAWYYFWRLCHSDKLTLHAHHRGVAFAPDGRLLAISGADSTVKVCDLATGQQWLVLQGGRIQCLAFSPDSKILGAGSEDGKVLLWNASTGQKEAELQISTKPVTDLTLAPGGNVLVAKCLEDSNKGAWTVQLVEVQKRVITPLVRDLQTAGLTMAWPTLTLRNLDGTLRRIDLLTRREGSPLPKSKGGGVITCQTFSRDGRLVASGTGDASFFGMGGVINRIMATDIKATALAGNFKLMGEVSVWDAATGQNKLTLPGHAGAVSCLAFAADAKQLASGSTGTGTFSFSAPLGERQQGQLKLWDVATGREMASVDQRDGVWAVAFSPDGRIVAYGSGAFGEVKLMDSGTGKVRTMFQGHSAPIFALTFSHDGRTLTSASEDGTVRLWDVNAVAEPTLYGAQPVNNNLSISPDSKTLAFVGFDGLLHLANLDSGTVQQANSVTDAAIFAPDGKTYVTAGIESFFRRSIIVWDLATRRPCTNIGVSWTNAIYALALSPDGRMNPNPFPIGESRPSDVKLWDVGTRKLRFTLRGHLASVQAVAFAPDGQTMATTGEDRTVKLWDVVSGKHLTTFRGGTRGGKALAFSGDHKWLAALDADGTVRLWRAATEKEVEARSGE